MDWGEILQGILVAVVIPVAGILGALLARLIKKGIDSVDNENLQKLAWLGVRWAESRARSKRKMVEACNRGSKWYVNPIIDWSDTDVWQFIRERSLPYCCLYDEGFKRLGCILCPMQGTRGMLRDAERWPGYKAAYVRAFDRMLAARTRPVLPVLNWSDGEAVYRWWVYNPDSVDKAQIAMWE